MSTAPATSADTPRRTLQTVPEVGRALPHSLEAEEALLALLLTYPDEVFPLCRTAKFSAKSFYEAKHGTIYAAVAALGEAQKPIDLATVAERLRETGELEPIGGYATLAQVTAYQGTSARARHWIDQVRKLWILRQTIRRVAEITEKCYAYAGEPFAEFFAPHSAWFQTALARARLGDRGSIDTLAESVDRISSDIAARAAGTEDRSGWIYTGFPEFDDVDSPSCMFPFGSAREDGNVIIGGGSSMGKSVLMRNLADVAIQRGQRVLVYTLETSRDGFVEALAAGRARVNLRTLARAPRDHVERLQASLAEVKTSADKRLFVFEGADDPSLRHIEGICAHARAWCAQHGTPHLIVLDYLQLVGTINAKCRSREQEVAHVSHSWQALQRELGCVTLGGAQLNEAALAPLRVRKTDKEGRVVHEVPTRGALRESQALYHDADIVIFLHLPVEDCTGRDQTTGDVSRPEMWLVVDKRRNGTRSRVVTWFDKQFGRFEPKSAAMRPAPASTGARPPVRAPRLPLPGGGKHA
jgi:replicative DNA helicase